MTKCPRNALSPSAADCELEIKVLAEEALPEAHLLPVTSHDLSPAPVYAQISSSCKDTGHVSSGPTEMTSF